ncbi:MAG: hypothetical protein ACI87A_002740, partial [Planctomycetota bacterium]
RAKIYARLALHFEKPLDDEDIIGRLNMMLIADPPAADETE